MKDESEEMKGGRGLDYITLWRMSRGNSVILSLIGCFR